MLKKNKLYHVIIFTIFCTLNKRESTFLCVSTGIIQLSKKSVLRLLLCRAMIYLKGNYTYIQITTQCLQLTKNSTHPTSLISSLFLPTLVFPTHTVVVQCCLKLKQFFSLYNSLRVPSSQADNKATRRSSYTNQSPHAYFVPVFFFLSHFSFHFFSRT